MAAFEDYGSKSAGKKAAADTTPDKSGRALAFFAAGAACLIGLAVVFGLVATDNPDAEDVAPVAQTTD